MCAQNKFGYGVLKRLGKNYLRLIAKNQHTQRKVFRFINTYITNPNGRNLTSEF